MKVVLVTKIKNLGNIGDIVDVKSGFARNFLLPYHKALPATDDYIKDFEEKKEEYLKKAKSKITFVCKAGNKIVDTINREIIVSIKLIGICEIICMTLSYPIVC